MTSMNSNPDPDLSISMPLMSSEGLPPLFGPAPEPSLPCLESPPRLPEECPFELGGPLEQEGRGAGAPFCPVSLPSLPSSWLSLCLVCAWIKQSKSESDQKKSESESESV